MAHDVFISYQQADKAVADAVCHRMEAAGVRCWIAPRDITHGKTWDDAVVDALTAAKVLVLIFSAAANASRNVVNEVKTALDAGATVMPFRIEDIRPTGGLGLHLGRVHWLDALTPPLDASIDQLIESVKRNLPAAREAEGAEEERPPEQAPSPKEEPDRKPGEYWTEQTEQLMHVAEVMPERHAERPRASEPAETTIAGPTDTGSSRPEEDRLDWTFGGGLPGVLAALAAPKGSHVRPVGVRGWLLRYSFGRYDYHFRSAVGVQGWLLALRRYFSDVAPGTFRLLDYCFLLLLRLFLTIVIPLCVVSFWYPIVEILSNPNLAVPNDVLIGLISVMVVDFAITGYGVYAGYSLWSISRNAVRRTKRFLVISLAYPLSIDITYLMPGFNKYVSNDISDIIPSSLWFGFVLLMLALIVFFYLDRSKRVAKLYR